MVGNNHHVAVKNGEDFQMFEKDLPGGNTTGFAPSQSIGKLPFETCETINNSWGFNINDRSFKSSKQIIHYLVNDAGRNANFLLNIGPMPNGKIQSEFTDTLAIVGAWVKKEWRKYLRHPRQLCTTTAMGCYNCKSQNNVCAYHQSAGRGVYFYSEVKR